MPRTPLPHPAAPEAEAIGSEAAGPRTRGSAGPGRTGASLRRRNLMAGLVGAVGLTAACGPSSGSAGEGGSDGGGGSAEGFPLELANCEATLTFDAPPERIVLLESAPVTTLDGIGVLDRVVSRAGAFPPGCYDEDLAARIEAIPTLSDEIDASGHLQISQEMVIAQEPDIVFGLPDGVTREAMADAGAQVVVQNVYCASDHERSSFETLHEQIKTYGQIFDHGEQAEQLSTSLQERIDAASEPAKDLATATAAVLYPSVGGGPLYTYGAASMVTAQLDALGIENVFADTEERVFEISAEPLLAADPDVLIVLHQTDGDGSDVAEEMISQDQLGSLRAVQDQALLPLLFNFAEPASPLVVDGLERIHDWLVELEG